MSDDFISQSLKGILLNGINLSLESIEEEQHYILKLLEFFEAETKFTAYLKKDATALEVETPELNLAMEIHIIDSVLFMVPFASDVFEVFAEVLRFISNNHEKIIREFRGIEENKIESITELNERIKNGTTEKKEQTEEEPSSDDDYEWI
tara:strand:+ start:114 stop:563 length:450 start_codon:yes stop_codon:yes gene_type:complete